MFKRLLLASAVALAPLAAEAACIKPDTMREETVKILGPEVKTRFLADHFAARDLAELLDFAYAEAVRASMLIVNEPVAGVFFFDANNCVIGDGGRPAADAFGALGSIGPAFFLEALFDEAGAKVGKL